MPQYISKLVLNGVTQMDVTQDTVSASNLLSGETATGADGAPVTGSIASKSSSNVTVSGDTVTVPAGYYASQVTKSVASGTAGTPTATKGTVSNHSVSVTPSVTNTTGYITGSTKTGTAVTVSASELVSGTKTITDNGTGIDVTNFASVDVSVSVGSTHTATITQGVSSRTNVKYNGVTYRATDATFEFSAGDTCSLEAYGQMGGGTIYEDGVQIGTSDRSSPYTYTLPDCDVEFELQTNGGGRIDITKVSSSITVNPLSVTQNGTYTAPTGTAYSPVTVNIPGGGLEYEEGTYTPTADADRPTISFSNTHSTIPSVVVMSDTSAASSITSNSNTSFAFYTPYELFGVGYPYSTTATRPSVVFYTYRTSSGSTGAYTQITYSADNTGDQSNTYTRYWVTESGFKPYSDSSTRYWRSGRSYKWIAIWK